VRDSRLSVDYRGHSGEQTQSHSIKFGARCKRVVRETGRLGGEDLFLLPSAINPLMLRDHRFTANASRGVYAPAFADTKLYGLVTVTK